MKSLSLVDLPAIVLENIFQLIVDRENLSKNGFSMSMISIRDLISLRRTCKLICRLVDDALILIRKLFISLDKTPLNEEKNSLMIQNALRFIKQKTNWTFRDIEIKFGRQINEEKITHLADIFEQGPGTLISPRRSRLLLPVLDFNSNDFDFNLFANHFKILSFFQARKINSVNLNFQIDRKFLKSSKSSENQISLKLLLFLDCIINPGFVGLKNLFFSAATLDMKCLVNLTQMRDLADIDCQLLIPSAEELAHQMNLSGLTISEPLLVSSKSFLANVKNMTHLNWPLNISSTNLRVDLKLLSQLNISERLEITATRFSANLDHLTHLRISEPLKINSDFFVANLERLSHLSISGSLKITSADLFSNLTVATHLNICGPLEIKSTMYRANLTNLTQLNIQGSLQINATHLFMNITNSSQLSVCGPVQIMSSDFCANLTNLTQLSISGQIEINSARFFVDLTNLTQLIISGPLAITSDNVQANFPMLKKLRIIGPLELNSSSNFYLTSVEGIDLTVKCHQDLIILKRNVPSAFPNLRTFKFAADLDLGEFSFEELPETCSDVSVHGSAAKYFAKCRNIFRLHIEGGMIGADLLPVSLVVLDLSNAIGKFIFYLPLQLAKIKHSDTILLSLSKVHRVCSKFVSQNKQDCSYQGEALNVPRLPFKVFWSSNNIKNLNVIKIK